MDEIAILEKTYLGHPNPSKPQNLNATTCGWAVPQPPPPVQSLFPENGNNLDMQLLDSISGELQAKTFDRLCAIIKKNFIFRLIC